MKKGLFFILLGSFITWAWFSLRRNDKKTMDKVLELCVENVKNNVRRALIFGRILPSILLRRLLKRFV